MRRQVSLAMMQSPKLSKLASHVRFIETRDGLRIDLVDDANYSMFGLGTRQFVPEADKLIGLIAQSIQPHHDPRPHG